MRGSGFGGAAAITGSGSASICVEQAFPTAGAWALWDVSSLLTASGGNACSAGSAGTGCFGTETTEASKAWFRGDGTAERTRPEAACPARLSSMLAGKRHLETVGNACATGSAGIGCGTSERTRPEAACPARISSILVGTRPLETVGKTCSTRAANEPCAGKTVRGGTGTGTTGSARTKEAITPGVVQAPRQRIPPAVSISYRFSGCQVSGVFSRNGKILAVTHSCLIGLIGRSVLILRTLSNYFHSAPRLHFA
jgi:hypothetical protein